MSYAPLLASTAGFDPATFPMMFADVSRTRILQRPQDPKGSTGVMIADPYLPAWGNVVRVPNSAPRMRPNSSPLDRRSPGTLRAQRLS
jgi:hypothetical protein